MFAVNLRAAILVAMLLAAGQAAAAGAVERQVRFSFSLHNPTSVELAQPRFWFYVPATTPSQTLERLDVNVAHKIRHDEAGNTYVEIAYDRVPPFATRIVSVAAHVSLATTATRAKGRGSDAFLRAEPLIESEDADLRAVAKALERAQPSDTARAIYEWVGSNLRYSGFDSDDRGASFALKERRGDCTEYASLAAALARASGIPSRVVGGYDVEGDSVLIAEAYHNWAEVLLDGRWHILDAQKGRWQAQAAPYVAFRLTAPGADNPLGSAHRFRASGGLLAGME